MNAQLQQVIRTDLAIAGQNTPSSPFRNITQWWTPEGEFIVRDDPHLGKVMEHAAAYYTQRTGRPGQDYAEVILWLMSRAKVAEPHVDAPEQANLDRIKKALAQEAAEAGKAALSQATKLRVYGEEVDREQQAMADAAGLTVKLAGEVTEEHEDPYEAEADASEREYRERLSDEEADTDHRESGMSGSSSTTCGRSFDAVLWAASAVSTADTDHRGSE